MEYLYEIKLEVPLGIRRGNMSLYIEDEGVSGEIEILGNREPFDGSISKDGVISIVGELVSLVRNVPYKGIGNMKENTLQMLLCVEGDSYKLTGCQINR